MKKQGKSEKLKEMLLARHGRCLENIRRLRKELTATSDVVGPEDGVVIAGQQAAVLMQMEAFDLQIEGIEAALNALEEGTYGRCHGCGGSIPIARLYALPFAKQCVECQGADECRS